MQCYGQSDHPGIRSFDEGGGSHRLADSDRITTGAILDDLPRRLTIGVWRLKIRSVFECAFRLSMEGIYAETVGHVCGRGVNFSRLSP